MCLYEFEANQIYIKDSGQPTLYSETPSLKTWKKKSTEGPHWVSKRIGLVGHLVLILTPVVTVSPH